MFEIVLNRERTQEYDFTLSTESGGPVVLAAGDKVRVVGYRRYPADANFDLTSGAATTANGSSVSITTAVPSVDGVYPVARLHLGQADLASLVPGTVLSIEIIVTDADGAPTNALLGPIHGYASVIGTSEVVV